MNQSHYEVLRVLYDSGKTSPVNNMTLKDMLSENNSQSNLYYTPNTVYKLIIKLKTDKLISDGLKTGKENTYYITQLGIQTKLELEGITIG